MSSSRWVLGSLLIVAGLALWLLLAGPARVLGIDSGNLGVFLLMTAAWSSLYAISRLPRSELDTAISPGEWRAWLGLGLMGVATIYLLANVQAFVAGPAWDNPQATRVGRNLVLLLIAWAVLGKVMATRWKGLVQEDERDRQIERHAASWGHCALVAFLVGLAFMLGFSPADRLRWATHFMIANLLVSGLMWSWLVEYAATVFHYWRDRR